MKSSLEFLSFNYSIFLRMIETIHDYTHWLKKPDMGQKVKPKI